MSAMAATIFLLGLSDMLNFRLNEKLCIIGETVNHDAVSSDAFMYSSAA